jgi:hypothetical protein
MRSDPSIAPDYSVSFIIRQNVTAGNRLVTFIFIEWSYQALESVH